MKEYREVKIVSDGDGHEFLVPVELVEEFNKLVEVEDWDSIQEFDKYALNGCISQSEIFVKATGAYKLPGKRRSGQTTRIIDAAIQTLFEEGEVIVKDHYNSRDANLDAIKKIYRRFVMEHPLLKDTIEIDPMRFSIKFKKSYTLT